MSFWFIPDLRKADKDRGNQDPAFPALRTGLSCLSIPEQHHPSFNTVSQQSEVGTRLRTPTSLLLHCLGQKKSQAHLRFKVWQNRFHFMLEGPVKSLWKGHGYRSH